MSCDVSVVVGLFADFSVNVVVSGGGLDVICDVGDGVFDVGASVESDGLSFRVDLQEELIIDSDLNLVIRGGDVAGVYRTDNARDEFDGEFVYTAWQRVDLTSWLSLKLSIFTDIEQRFVGEISEFEELSDLTYN